MADASNGIGGSRPGGSIVIPGRARHVPTDADRREAPTRQTQRDPAERQYVNLDGQSFDLLAPRGTYVNIVV
jgi:hypothetical protein